MSGEELAMEIEKLSLSELKKYEKYVPGLGNFPSRFCTTDYDDFVGVLYKDIDTIVAEMEENPEHYMKDSEDRLTIQIKISLRLMGYEANHDAKIGGHTDLSVKKPSQNWLWIGEAKLYGGPKYLMTGFKQLTTRYSPGNYNNNQGGMLIYIQKKDAKMLMDKWGKMLVSEGDISESFACGVNPLSFYSKHKHQRTGLDFTVRHIPFVLYFDPRDR